MHDHASARSRSNTSDVEARAVWHLVLPGRRPVWCEIRRVESGFQLVLTTGDEVFVTDRSVTLEEAHAAATRWRAALESRGYATPQSAN